MGLVKCCMVRWIRTLILGMETGFDRSCNLWVLSTDNYRSRRRHGVVEWMDKTFPRIMMTNFEMLDDSSLGLGGMRWDSSTSLWLSIKVGLDTVISWYSDDCLLPLPTSTWTSLQCDEDRVHCSSGLAWCMTPFLLLGQDSTSLNPS